MKNPFSKNKPIAPKARKKVVLLGDSVIDNKAYTSGGPSTGEHLQTFLGGDWDVIDKAEDGAVAYDVWAQIADIPDAVDQIILCVGGNDALKSKGILSSKRKVGDGLAKIEDDVAYFQAQHAQLLDALVSWKCPISVCTVYNGSFDGDERAAIVPAVRIFNDAIYSNANKFGVSVIDLRTICTDDRDYFNPIEPGNLGGAKIAAAFADACLPADENQYGGWGSVGKSLVVREYLGNEDWLDTPTRLIDFDDEEYLSGIDWAKYEDEQAQVIMEPGSSGTYEALYDLDAKYEDVVILPDPFNDEKDQRFDTVMSNEIEGVAGLGRRSTDL